MKTAQCARPVLRTTDSGRLPTKAVTAKFEAGPFAAGKAKRFTALLRRAGLTVQNQPAGTSGAWKPVTVAYDVHTYSQATYNRATHTHAVSMHPFVDVFDKAERELTQLKAQGHTILTVNVIQHAIGHVHTIDFLSIDPKGIA
jgi:hypothetical protein